MWLPVAVFDGVLVIPGIVDLVTETFYNYPTAVHVILPLEGHGGARAIIKRD